MYLKYLYKFETLVPFEAHPLRLDAAIPAMLTAFPLKILDNVSSIGSGAGIAASSRRGSTSKGTKVSNLYKYFKYISLTIPGIFGSLHVSSDATFYPEYPRNWQIIIKALSWQLTKSETYSKSRRSEIWERYNTTKCMDLPFLHETPLFNETDFTILHS